MPERNPFEETRQAAQNWNPREQYISRSNQDRMQDATINRFIQESRGDQQRWEQGGGQGPYPVFNDPGANYSPPITQGWLEASSGRDNSGIMAADAGNIMNKYKQFTDTFGDFGIGRDGVEYEKDFDIPWGGTGTFEGWGGDDSYGAGINFSWPLGQSAALDRGIGSTDEYQMAKALDPNVALDILGDPNRNMDSILQIYGDDAWDRLPSFKIGDKWYGNPALGMPGKMGSGWST